MDELRRSHTWTINSLRQLRDDIPRRRRKVAAMLRMVPSSCFKLNNDVFWVDLMCAERLDTLFLYLTAASVYF